MHACRRFVANGSFFRRDLLSTTSALAVIGFALAAGGATPATAFTGQPTTQAQAQDTRAAVVRPASGQRFASATRAKDKEKAAKDATADLLAKAKDPYNIIISIDRQHVLNAVDGCLPSDLATGSSDEIEEEREDNNCVVNHIRLSGMEGPDKRVQVLGILKK